MGQHKRIDLRILIIIFSCFFVNLSANSKLEVSTKLECSNHFLQKNNKAFQQSIASKIAKIPIAKGLLENAPTLLLAYQKELIAIQSLSTVDNMASCALTNPFPGFPIDFLNDNTGWIDYTLDNMTIVGNGDGTMTILGDIIDGTPVDFGSGSNGTSCGASDSWSVEITLSDRKTYTEWQATTTTAGAGQAKVHADCAGTVENDLDYWAISGTLIGTGCNVGRTLNVTGAKAPYRLQIGFGGNDGDNTCAFSLSTWIDIYENGNPINADIYAFIDETCYNDAIKGLNIKTTYSDNCMGDHISGYTADWNVGIEAFGEADAAISYQRNSDAIQSHTLTGTTDTLTIAGIPADGGVSDTLKVWLTNDTTCGDTIILKRPTPCPVTTTFCEVVDDGDMEAGNYPGGGTPVAFAGGTRVNFEDQTPDSWIATTDTNFGENYWVESSAAYRGNKYLYTFSSGTTDDETDACNQYDISGLPGGTSIQICVYAADANADGNSSGLAIEIEESPSNSFHYSTLEVADNPAWDDNALTSIPWQQYCYTFTTQASTNSGKIWISASTQAGTAATSYLVMDDMSVCTSGGTEIPSGEICSTVGSNEIKGTVFEDWNYDGIMNQSDTVGVQGVQVDLYDDCGNVDQTTYTDSNGNYEFSSLTDGTTYRVEFSLPESVSCWAKPTKAGADNGTTVQFVQPGNCASLGVAQPTDYCDTNPYVALPCYENGAASGNTEPAMVSYRYLTEGIPAQYADKYAPYATSTNPRKDAQIQEVGSTYGLGWQRSQNRAFTASTIRRHAGLGPAGIGGVYVFDYAPENATGTLLGSINLQGVNGIDLGSINRNEVPGYINGDYDLPQNRFYPSIDLDAFDKVGKASFGDADVFNDNELWLVNLNQRALIQLDISNPDLPTIQNSATQYTIDNLSGLPTCTNTPLPRPEPILINMSSSISQNYIDGDDRFWRSSSYSDGGAFNSDASQTFANTNNGTGLGATVDNYLYQQATRDDSLNIHIGHFNGTYDVVLHLATRAVDDNTLYDVEAEGNLVVDDFDLWDNAGAAYTAQTIVLQDIEITDEQLNIQIRGIDQTTGNPATAYVRAVEIISDGTWTPPSYSANVLRPYALKFHKGRGYLGLMCTGENSRNLDDVMSFVASFDPTNISAGFQVETSLSMNYLREGNINSTTGNAESFHHSSDWHPWANNWQETGYPEFTNFTYSQTYPQPILTDIEFEDNGSMLLGFADRWGSQTGYYNYPPIAGFRYAGTRPYIPFFISTAGDLVKFCHNNGQYILEGTTASCSINDVGIGTKYSVSNDGPSGNGEFYYGDGYFRYDPDAPVTPYTSGHNEVLFGALAVLPGSGEILANAFDPIQIDTFKNGAINNLAQTQGTRIFNSMTGAYERGYVIVDRPESGADSLNITNFGKGIGLGDMELLCAPAPIEIGNYVWEDTDSDGIQDACESPIENVILTLYNTACEIVAVDTTDANGQYYFNDTKIAAYTTQSDTTLAPNTTYHVVITGANGGSWSTNASTLTIGSNTYDIALANQGNNDLIDSDGTIGTVASACNSVNNGYAFASVTTGDAGCVDHSIDFAFILRQHCPILNLSTNPTEICAGDSTELSLSFDSITGNAALYWSTTLLDSTAINSSGHGGATFIDSTRTGVVINEVDYIGGESVELWNTSCETVDVSNWSFCYKFGYNDLNTATISSGDLILSPGEKVAFSNLPNITMNDSSGSLGLYKNNSDFGDPANMVDYVQWRAGGQARESVAVAKGIWTAGDFVAAITSGNTIQYDGYGDHSADWGEGAPTFGNTNVNTNSPLTATFDSGALANAMNSPITYYFYAILTDENCNRTAECQPVAVDSVVVNPIPEVTTTDADICEGLSVNLDTLVTNVNNTVNVDTAYFMTMQDAVDSTNAIASLVSPTTSTTYFVRLSTNTNPSCYVVENLTITVNNIITTISTTCNDNGTGGDENDDTFTITVNATNASPGTSGQYLVIYNGMTLNGSGTAYGMAVTVSHADFVANGSFSPPLTIRDIDDVGCEEMVMVAAVASCSTCPPEICLPVKTMIKRGGGTN